jgi:exonuclease SbcC
MLPVRLELKNFLAYRAPDALRFDGIHLACLTGANGAGKSSLLDAITWALWGKSRARHDDDLIHTGQDETFVQLDFEQEGAFYRVIRKRVRGKRGKTELALLARVDDTWNTISEPSVRETEDKIRRLLRLDYETFVHSAFLQQGRADAFTLKTPAERKRILSDMLGLEQWAVYEDRAKERSSALKGEISQIDGILAEIDRELEQEPNLRRALDEAERQHDAAQRELEAAEARVQEVAHAPEALRAAQEEAAQCARRVESLSSKLKAEDDTIQKQRQKVEALAAVVDQRAEIEAGYATLTAARAAFSALGGKLMELQQFDDEQRQLETALRDEQARLESAASGHQRTVDELTRTIQAADADELARVQQEIAGLRVREQEQAQAQQQVSDCNTERAGLDSASRHLHAEGEALKKRIAGLSEARDAFCPLCGQPLDADQRQRLIADLEAELAQRRADWQTNADRIKQIDAEVRTLEPQIAERDRELKRLPALTERLGGLQARLDAAHAAAIRLGEARAQADAIRDTLARGDFAHDIRARLDELMQRRAAVGYDADGHSAARQQLETYQTYEERYWRLDDAARALPEAIAALEQARQRRESLAAELAEEEASAARLRDRIAELTAQVGVLREREQEAARLRTAEVSARDAVTTARQRLKTLEAQRERRRTLEERRAARRYDETLYQELRAAFGKDGIPAMIIEAAIPELESGANRLLARMTDGRMTLRFDTQREAKSRDGAIETLDIQIADELGTRSYELYSGGEAFRINFAIRVALSQLLARRAGAQLRTLFLDEGFGTQDDDGRGKLVEAITAVQDDFDLILVITHMDDLRDSFPVHIAVEKTTSGSRLSLR